MRRCPVAAWEGWTTKPLHENTKKGGRGKPSAAQSYPATERRNRAPSQISRWLPTSRPEQVRRQKNLAQTKPAVWGAVGGVIATLILGFYWGGRQTTSAANRMANEQSEKKVIAALAPPCARGAAGKPDPDRR
jgi:hypothetical protein